MSVPSKIYYCDKCDYQSGDLCLMGDFYYRTGTLTIPLQRKLAWCNTCSQLQPCEDFSDRSNVIEKIQGYQNDLAKYRAPFRALLAILITPYIQDKKFLQAELAAYTVRLQLIDQRKGTECCLECGSQDILEFNNQAKLTPELWPGSYKGDEATGFAHPGCGGNIRVKGSDIRFIMKIKDLPYSPDGTKLFDH